MKCCIGGFESKAERQVIFMDGVVCAARDFETRLIE
jgi:hypothetical protein